MFGDFSEAKKKKITDPYFGGDKGFEECYRQCQDFSRGFIQKILRASA